MKQKLPLILTLACLWATAPAFSQDGWPKNIAAGDNEKITMYELQPESLNGDQLTGRAAVSFRKSADADPVFGAVFFNAVIDNNGSGKNATIESMKVTRAKFSGIEDQSQIDLITQSIEKNSSGWDVGMSAAQLRDAANDGNGAAPSQTFNNAAPKIIYANKPTTLVVLDGSPRIVHDKDLDADKIANSPNLIFKEGDQWNLYVGGNWYRSSSINDGWKQNNSLSAKVKSVNEAVKKQEKENNKDNAATADPRLTDIIVATEPTELMQTDGEPVYKTVAGTSLLYVSNSPNEIFKDIDSQESYILIAGRWYKANSMNGPWTYVPSDQLPEDFASIPEGSEKDNVLSNVAGTEAAEDARLDAAVPQTAKVDRRTASVTVEYDGVPVFNPIEGTSLQLAENSNLTVMIDASGNYFALDNGVWFIGNSAYGPWKVANDRPRDVDEIPASSPAYNTKYVYVYDETPDYVYTGYTSGYLGSYYYGPTIVYGTGYHYRPWFYNVYYPRPVTWGFGFMYDPWNGWNINWGYNYGYLYVGFDYGYRYGGYGYGYGYGGGWFGPQRYCPPYRNPYYGRGGYYGAGYNRRNDYGYSNNGRQNYGNGSRPGGSRPLQTSGPARRGNGSRRLTGWTNNTNLYNNQRGVTTQNLNRNTRIYTAARTSSGNSNLGDAVNNRYGTRVPVNGTRRGTNANNAGAPVQNNNSRLPAGNNNNNRLPPVTNNNGQRPVRYPRSNSGNNPSVGQPQENNAQQRYPATRPTQSRENPVITRPSSSGESPVIRRPQPAAEAPSSGRPEPVRREAPVNRAPVERPVRDYREVRQPQVRESAPVQRQERQAPPVQRPSVERQSAPAQRPSYDRPSAPQNNNSRESHGTRPSRR